MQTSNPVLSDKVFQNVRPVDANDVMTIDGTVNKSLICIFLTVASAYFAFGNPAFQGLALPAVILGAIFAFVAFFKPALSPYLAPAYSVVEGVALGAISFVFESAYGGIVGQAVFLTFAVLLGLLIAYKSGFIRATPTFKRIVVAGTIGIAAFYFVSIIAGLFGHSFSFMHDSSPLSIGISVLITGFAAMNLVLDFDQIENLATRANAPKYMEWYSALALLVTLVWLYLEILKLLSKLQSRD